MKLFQKPILLLALLALSEECFCWGFFAHQRINYYAIFLLPPQLLSFYKPHADYLTEHAVDADKRRYAVADEAPRHYLDLDHYGAYPFEALPRVWDSAVAKFGKDTLMQHGIAPWWIQGMQQRLTKAFREKNAAAILKLSADIGHYIADAHVPLHASSNHNGQLTGQQGIHAFWESRVPELLADESWDFFMQPAAYIASPHSYIWQRMLESAAAADTVLAIEKKLTESVAPDAKFAFETRNGRVLRQYATSFSKAYDAQLQGMIERRMRASVWAVASFWYTAWIDAGQPDMSTLHDAVFNANDSLELQQMNDAWRAGHIKGREHE